MQREKSNERDGGMEDVSAAAGVQPKQGIFGECSERIFFLSQRADFALLRIPLKQAPLPSYLSLSRLEFSVILSPLANSTTRAFPAACRS